MENYENEYTKIHRGADVYTEVSADYSLPDYNGDIKKVLYTSATVLPAARFNDAESVSASGIVSYDILYVNGEGELDHISFNSDYEVVLRVKSDEIDLADIETRVGGFSHRLFGPRRLNMKATLVSEVRHSQTAKLATGAQIMEMDDAECIVKGIKVADSHVLRSAEREYAECIAKLDGVIEDEVEVLYSTASYGIDSVKAEDGGVAIKGAVTVCAIIRCDGGAPAFYKKRIPFDEFISSDEVTSNMQAVGGVCISSVSCSTVGGDDGASVNASVIAEYSVRVSGNREMSFVRDAFLKSARSEQSYEKFAYTTHLGCDTGLFTATHTVPISDLSENGIRSVIYMGGAAKVYDMQISDGGVSVGVEIKLNGICDSIDSEGAINHFAVKSNCSVTEKVNINGQIPENAVVECKARVIDTTATVDEENLYIEVSYALESEAVVELFEDRLSEIRAVEGGEYEKRDSKITVYYPLPEDSLFTVARAYHTGVREIAAANMLSESVMNSFDVPGSLAGVKRLIIK